MIEKRLPEWRPAIADDYIDLLIQRVHAAELCSVGRFTAWHWQDAMDYLIRKGAAFLAIKVRGKEGEVDHFLVFVAPDRATSTQASGGWRTMRAGRLVNELRVWLAGRRPHEIVVSAGMPAPPAQQDRTLDQWQTWVEEQCGTTVPPIRDTRGGKKS